MFVRSSLIVPVFVVVAGALPAVLQPRQNVVLAPQPDANAWSHGNTSEFRIHSSCNVTEARQIRAGLAEAVQLADHAKQHVLRWGNKSEHYRKYFSNTPTGEVIGNFDLVVSGDRGGYLFRCDNPDGNCVLPGWGGHWRGSNATDETVICPLSYETRKSLSTICSEGYNVAEGATNTFWASDLIHRLYHMPAVGQNHIEHYAEDFNEVIELAQNNATYSQHDSDTLQYFALEVYAYDIAIPGVGCSGPQPVTNGLASNSATSSSSAVGSTAAPTATSTSAQAVSTTTSAGAECHTHDNGDVHCS